MGSPTTLPRFRAPCVHASGTRPRDPVRNSHCICIGNFVAIVLGLAPADRPPVPELWPLVCLASRARAAALCAFGLLRPSYGSASLARATAPWPIRLPVPELCSRAPQYRILDGRTFPLTFRSPSVKGVRVPLGSLLVVSAGREGGREGGTGGGGRRRIDFRRFPN